MPQLTEPNWTNGQPVETDPSAICSLGLSPTRITGILVRLLQAHFYDPDNIFDTQLKSLRWVANETDTFPIQNRILIEADTRYTPKTANQQPFIFVRRGEVSVMKIGIKGQMINHFEVDGTYLGPHCLRLVKGIHVVNVGAPTAIGSERLAEEVLNRFMTFSDAITQDFKFSEFVVKGMQETKKVEEASPAVFVTPVIIEWAYMHHWVLIQIAPFLKKISIVQPSI